MRCLATSISSLLSLLLLLMGAVAQAATAQVACGVRDEVAASIGVDDPSRITDFENAAYVRRVRARLSEPGLFFEMENPILKEMNDVLFKDKSMADAVVTRYKRIFLEKLETRLAPHAAATSPPVIVARYSDYKSLKLWLADDRPELRKALRDAYDEAGREFREFALKVQDERIPRSPRLTNPEGWMLAGVGRTPEEANIAARASRAIHGPTQWRGAQALEFDRISSYLWGQLREIESLRSWLQKRLGPGTRGASSGMMVPTTPGATARVLSADALAVLRSAKISGRDVEAYKAYLRSRFQARFGLKLSDEELTALRDYNRRADLFAPGLLFDKPRPIPFENSRHGLVSFDFAGLGAKNGAAVLAGLAELGGRTLDPAVQGAGIQLALQRVRTRVDRVTRNLELTKERIRAAFPDGQVHFSGDDGVVFLARELDAAGKSRALGLLAAAGEKPTDLRITFLPQNYLTGETIPSGQRSALIARAEALEKKLRESLEASGLNAADRGAAVGIDFAPKNETQGRYRLLLAPDGKITEPVAEKIREKFRAFFKTLSQESAPASAPPASIR